MKFLPPLLFGLCLSLGVQAAALPEVVKGELNLDGWDSRQIPTIPLTGEWRFYWQQLLTASELASHPHSYAQLSIPWNEQLIDGKSFAKTGFATYALHIKLPAGITEIAFVVPAVFNSYAFFKDDELICKSGRVANNPQDALPKWQPQTVRVKVASTEATIVFQISNFENTRGGCAEVMRLGDPEYVIWLNDLYHTTGKLLILFCAVLFVAGLVIFYLTGARSFFHLSLLGLAFMLRFLFSDLYLALDLGIELPWLVAAKLEYATVPMIVIAATTFMAGIYPNEFRKFACIFFQVTSAILILAIILVPSGGLTPLLFLMQILGLTLAIYCTVTILRAMVINRSGVWLNALSMGVLIVVASYNIYTFIAVIDLNRAIIHSGYAIALSLSAFSLIYRTPLRLRQEESERLRYEDLYQKA
ncbi:MAG: hypothetical protein KF775_06415 [Cyclobacteriaceae bacterium]|nr:hypothetical protein [Cyclobacteriaceae bacterium]